MEAHYKALPLAHPALQPHPSTEASALTRVDNPCHLPSAPAPGPSPPRGCGSRPSLWLSGEERSDKWLEASGSCYTHVSSSCPWGRRVREGTPKCKQGKTARTQDRWPGCGKTALKSDCASAGTAFRPGQHCHLVESLTIAPMGLRRVDAESQTSRSPGPAGRASIPTKPVSSYHSTPLVKVTLFFTDYKGIVMESPGNTQMLPNPPRSATVNTDVCLSRV